LAQDIEVPETLLKKRKQNEKAREERLAAAVAARKVRIDLGFAPFYDAYDYFDRMASGTCSTLMPSINHLSGLILYLRPITVLKSCTESRCPDIKGKAQSHLQAGGELC
jgi:hypothetical protein